MGRLFCGTSTKEKSSADSTPRPVELKAKKIPLSLDRERVGVRVER